MSEDQPSPVIRWEPLNIPEDEIVAEEERGEYKVKIVKGGDNKFDQSRISQLTESAFAALERAQKIDPAFDKSIRLVIGHDQTYQGAPAHYYMNVDGSVSGLMYQDSPASQTAAIVHELVHYLQDEEDFLDLNVECLPELAEFLLTGESRMSKYQHMQDDYFNGRAEHLNSQAWGRIVQLLNPGISLDDPDFVAGQMTAKRQLSDEEKNALIRQAVQQARAQNHNIPIQKTTP